MNDDQFKKMFEYMQGMNARVESIEDNMSTKGDVGMLLSTIDGYAAKIDNYATEMAAMQHKIDRLERYIQILAKKTGVDLEAVSL